MKKFNPNDIKKSEEKPYIWATYIPDRKPKFKVYNNRGYASSSIKYRSRYMGNSTYRVMDDCTLWNLVGEEWVEVKFEKTYKANQPLNLIGDIDVS